MRYNESTVNYFDATKCNFKILALDLFLYISFL